jgi:signal transduction histidine kinase
MRRRQNSLSKAHSQALGVLFYVAESKFFSSAAAGHAQISIKNTGMGVKPEILPYIVESFRQGEGARSHRGLGLGLSIASTLAKPGRTLCPLKHSSENRK